ncbi:hypothetical protein VE00_02881 [Pseudogymnoascus sp. WSF 3629]|nr:hypothetical protein VE00_02881 [Pseudogymnoascus sp. WSF 3629]
MDMDTQGRKIVFGGYDNINLDGLQEEMHRVLGLKCQFIMDTRERPFGGSECVIVVLEDEKKSKWAVRFPLQFRAFPEHVMLTVKNEAELRLAIEKAGISVLHSIVLHVSLSSFPSGQKGRNCGGLKHIPRSHNGRKCFKYTATSYITTLINRKIKRAENNKLPGATISECLDQQSLIAEYLMPDLDDAPCVLVHGDLTAENVIVDEDFNVKAIINLGFAEIIPLQFSACFPNFLTHDFESLYEPVEVEHGSGTDGPLVWQSRNTEMMRRDREFYLRCVEEFSRGDSMLEKYYQLLAAEDEVRRY